jgi:hypothetical protein
MKTATVNDIMGRQPCSDYTRERVTALWDGREALSALDILGLEIPVDDRFWAIFHNLFFTDKELRLMACDFAESTLHLYTGDSPAPAEAIRVSRLYANGEASSEDLDAARDAAWDAASEAADRDAASEAAARAAARAAWGAALAAARTAASGAEQQKQIEIIKRYLTAQEPTK